MQSATIAPRDYQTEALARVLEEFESKRSTLLVCATGLGKTVMAGMIAQTFIDRDRRVMLFAHREELISQAVHRFRDLLGVTPDIEMADMLAPTSEWGASPITVSSFQTLIAGKNRRRMERFDPKRYGLLIIDEAHRCRAKSYHAIVEYFTAGNPEIKILGLTATPDRADEKALGVMFESVAFEYGINDGIQAGYLVPLRSSIIDLLGVDFSSVPTKGGDFVAYKLAEVMEQEKVIQGIAGAIWAEVPDGERTLIFNASVAAAELTAEILNRRVNGCARVVSGTTPKPVRRQMLREYAEGRFQFLCNCQVATEGFDEPRIQHVVMARPTKSRALFTQMVGRGTRTWPGLIDGLDNPGDRRAAIAGSPKPGCNIIDFEGLTEQHSLVHCTDVLGGTYDEDVVDLATREMREGKTSDVGRALEDAARAIEKQKEAERKLKEQRERRRHIVGKAQYAKRTSDPFSELNVARTREPAWHKGRAPSQKMKDVLIRAGMFAEQADELTFVEAKTLISEICRRRNEGLATYKQARLLGRYRLPNDVKFDQASAWLDAIRDNGWRLPRELEVFRRAE